MSIYYFETVPGSQVLAYDSSTDELNFSDARATGASTLVIHAFPYISVLSLAENRPVAFGPGLAGETVTFVDGSKLLIGIDGADTLSGGSLGDGLFGGPGADKLSGGAGGDLLGGGSGADVLSGGAGADHFIVNAGESLPTLGAMDIITDWQFGDALSFGMLASLVTPSGRYVESTAADFSAALTFANAQIGSGAADYVAVAVGSDIEVFADSRSNNGTADDAVILAGRGLADIDATSLIDATASPSPSALPLPPPPPTPTPTPLPPEPLMPMAPHTAFLGASGRMSGDVDHAHLSYLLDAVITDASETEFTASVGDISLRLTGVDFALDDDGQLAGGLATSISYAYGAAHGGPFSLSVSIPYTELTKLAVWAVTDATQTAFTSIFRGDDNLGGGVGPDVLRGYDGGDLLYGAGGSDTIWGGLGNDVIYGQATPTTTAGAAGSTYLRGEEGNDYVLGGVGFDDINGNAGADTLSGDMGDDWVVGGKDNDLQFGYFGNDIVWGNLGNDTLVGNDGSDQVRGGQGDDIIYGSAGNDFVSGDRGNDTIVGGTGADLFHGSQDAGIDRVLDFSLAEGDRVMLDPGTTYTLSQVGADTVIDMGGGHQMILVGVQLSTLTPGWVFGA